MTEGGHIEARLDIFSPDTGELEKLLDARN